MQEAPTRNYAEEFDRRTAYIRTVLQRVGAAGVEYGNGGGRDSTLVGGAFDRKRYSRAMPFTNEALLYRELFEKYYPGQAEMIAGFWMPNPNWDGCNVNDPSARVPSNYWNSGEWHTKNIL